MPNLPEGFRVKSLPEGYSVKDPTPVEQPQPTLAGQSDLLGGGGGEPYTEEGGRAALAVAPLMAAPLMAGATISSQIGQGAVAGGTALALGQSPKAAAIEAGLTIAGLRHGPKLLQLIRGLRGAAPAVVEAAAEGIPVGTRAAKAAETAREIEASRAAARRALMGAKEAAPAVDAHAMRFGNLAAEDAVRRGVDAKQAAASIAKSYGIAPAEAEALVAKAATTVERAAPIAEAAKAAPVVAQEAAGATKGIAEAWKAEADPAKAARLLEDYIVHARTGAGIGRGLSEGQVSAVLSEQGLPSKAVRKAMELVSSGHGIETAAVRRVRIAAGADKIRAASKAASEPFEDVVKRLLSEGKQEKDIFQALASREPYWRIRQAINAAAN